ncbi:MAG: pyridoxal-phosphate dependent enzyme, partial [Staphylothermus sp.]|nr:pyridoxal-phosphate dependent enzyme [Staphylothermus sp.]
MSERTAHWFCPKCGFKESIWNKYYWKCPKCGNPLDIEYEEVFEPRGNRFLRYSSYFPFKPIKTRGEGGTPLIIDENGRHKLLYKLEYMNPSGSFKDRGTLLSITYAYLMNYRNVVEDTSGNTGISVTLYSKVYGLEATIIMPSYAPIGKKKLVQLLGGKIVEAPTRTGASNIVLQYVENSYYVAHTWSYFYIIGASTISFEIFEEYGVPDYIVIPVGSGGLFLGVLHGFEYLKKIGIINKVPIPIAVQGYSVQPVYEKIYGAKKEGEKSELADGILVANPPRINTIVHYLKRFRGKIILVGNSDIRKALSELFQKGFIVEPTSATIYAAYTKLREELPQSDV